MSNKEMTTIVLNVLPEEWGNFTSSIYGKKEATPFNELWSLCKFKETRLKAKIDVGSSEQAQAFATMARRKRWEAWYSEKEEHVEGSMLWLL